MNRKTRILDPHSSVTPVAPEVIDLKFGMHDYVVGATQHAKNYNNRPSSSPPSKWVKYVQMFFYLGFTITMMKTAVFKPPPPVGVGGGNMFLDRPSVPPSVRPWFTWYVSAISPVSVDGFSPNFCHWCILGHRWPDYVFGSKGQSSRSHNRGGGAQYSTLPSSATFSSCQYYSFFGFFLSFQTKFSGQTLNLHRCGPKNTNQLSATLTHFSRSQTHFCAKNPKLQIHITLSFMTGFRWNFAGMDPHMTPCWWPTFRWPWPTSSGQTRNRPEILCHQFGQI